MATQQVIKNLENNLKALSEIKMDDLLRENLGDESRKKDFEPLIIKINNRLRFAIEYAEYVPDNRVNGVIAEFNNIITYITQHSKRNNSEYISHSNNVITSITTALNNTNENWPHFITAAIEKRGFLDDEELRQQYQDSILQIKQESENALKKVNEEAKATIDAAKKLAEEIETKARRTAAKISVEEAQKQFGLAQKGLRIHIGIWSVISVGMIVGFIIYAVNILNITFPEKWSWQIIYYAAIRFAILTFIGSLLTYYSGLIVKTKIFKPLFLFSILN